MRALLPLGDVLSTGHHAASDEAIKQIKAATDDVGVDCALEYVSTDGTWDVACCRNTDSSLLLLLFSGIHNAWDNVAYHVFVNKRDTNTEQR